MNDKIQGFSFDNRAARGYLIRIDECLTTVYEQHHYPQALKALLGESLLTSALLMAPLKFEGQVTLQFQGEGPISLLVAKCNHRFEVRALAQYQNGLTSALAKSAFERGRLIVTCEPNHTVEPYQSIIELNSGSIARSMEAYFLQSEQLPTRLLLCQEGDKAAGLFLQQVPEEGQFEDWEHLLALTNSLTDEELLTLPFEAILHRLYHQEEVRLYPETEVMFNCPCSYERMSMAVKTLGLEEAEQILSEKQVIEVVCEYCNTAYDFAKDEVRQIFQKPS